MSRIPRVATVLLLGLAALLSFAMPASAAVGDRTCLTNRAGSEVCGIEVEGDPAQPGVYIDTNGDGRWDGADTNGDGQTDRAQGVVTDPETNNACSIGDLACAAGEVAKGAANDAMDAVAEQATTTVGRVVASLGTIWTTIGTPNLTGEGSASEWLRGELAFYTGVMAVVAVFIGCALMAIQRRAQPGKDLAGALVRFVIVNTAVVGGLGLAVSAGDSFSVYIIDQAVAGSDFGANITGLIALSGVVPFGSFAVIFLAIGAFLASVVQIVLMVARGGLLVLVAGLLPLASSFTNLPAGRHWHQKLVGWTVAALLYKPAAAIVYAVAFRLTGSDVFGGDGLISMLTGLMLMIMALLALPALMALAVPSVNAAANRGGGGGGGAMAAGAVATGAAVIQLKSGSGSGSGKQSGAPGPAGSPSGAVPGAVGGRGGQGPSGATTSGAKGAAGAAGGAAAAAGVVGGVASLGQAAVDKARQSTADTASGNPTGGQQ